MFLSRNDVLHFSFFLVRTVLENIIFYPFYILFFNATEWKFPLIAYTNYLSDTAEIFPTCCIIKCSRQYIDTFFELYNFEFKAVFKIKPIIILKRFTFWSCYHENSGNSAMALVFKRFPPKFHRRNLCRVSTKQKKSWKSILTLELNLP